MKTYEIRDPIHGFIELDEWEWDIINHPVFQRLRRIRQLAWTDMVYPGAMHTRFEHSLGVMHVATKMFDSIVKRRSDFLKSELSVREETLKRHRVFIRIAALLHDIGHSPFSHAGEGLMEEKEGSKEDNRKYYKHEDCSAAIILHLMKDIIEEHPINKRNYEISSKAISDFLEKKPEAGIVLFWHPLISGQIDADRADYLLRDSYHIGVQYGKYDLNRLINTLTVVNDPISNNPLLAVEKGGVHAVEGLIIARYMMFTQVYFHHTRRAFDYHIKEAIKKILIKFKYKTFPLPNSKENLEKYTEWDDWKILNHLKDRAVGRHVEALIERKHDRAVYETKEMPSLNELDMFEKIRNVLGKRVSFPDSTSNSWYKFEKEDIPISEGNLINPLSVYSSVVNGLKPVRTQRIYVQYKNKETSKKIVEGIITES